MIKKKGQSPDRKVSFEENLPEKGESPKKNPSVMFDQDDQGHEEPKEEEEEEEVKIEKKSPILKSGGKQVAIDKEDADAEHWRPTRIKINDEPVPMGDMKASLASQRSSLKHSTQPLVDSKKKRILKVMVVDVKPDIPTEYKANEVIAVIDSEKAAAEGVIFGKGPRAHIQFASSNEFIGEEQFVIQYDRPHFTLTDIGRDYPTLIRFPTDKKVLLSRYDYVSLSEQSDFYVMDLVSDDVNPTILNDAVEFRYFDAKNEPKTSHKKSITLKFHDGALVGNKFVLEAKKTTFGRSNQRELIIPSTATTVSKLHCTLMYEKGYWYLTDHSTYGTFLYPRTVKEMKNQAPSSRIKV